MNHQGNNMNANQAVYQGILSLDLDGTLVSSGAMITPILKQTLNRLQSLGMTLLFNTGRNFSFAELVLRELTFPYFVGAQNGAVLANGVTKEVLIQKNLPSDFSENLDALEERFGVSFVLETGAKNKDLCYYSSAYLTPDLKKYFLLRQRIQKSHWNEIAYWGEFPKQNFSMVKALASMESLESLEREIKKRWNLSSIIIRDPFKEGKGILLLNGKDVNKGTLIDDMLNLKVGSKPIIAAGDDACDAPMLKKADFALVSMHAKKELLDLADQKFTLENIHVSLSEITQKVGAL